MHVLQQILLKVESRQYAIGAFPIDWKYSNADWQSICGVGKSIPFTGDVTTSSPNRQSPIGADASGTQLNFEHVFI